MKIVFILFSLFFVLASFSQSETEVFLADLTTVNKKLRINNIQNISQNEGYDNQPSFLDNHTLFFSSTRNGQTDILKYSVIDSSKVWICETEGSEYSPLKIPNQNAVSAIRLDKDGTQLLRHYDLATGESKVLVKELKIGYHVWYDENILVATVLENDAMSLYVINMKTKSHQKIVNNVGRSLHKIPNSTLVSYISKKTEGVLEIKSLNPASGETNMITNAFPNSEDICWLPDGSMLTAYGSTIYQSYENNEIGWESIVSLHNYNINNISRIAVSHDGKKIAIVGELSK